MTRDEMRAKAIEVMVESSRGQFCTDGVWKIVMTEALDALGAAGFKVVGPEVTGEMHIAAKRLREADKAKQRPTAWGTIFLAMAKAGDLTREPE